eukprot:4581101-Pyramimonas_sp.AAC.1
MAVWSPTRWDKWSSARPTATACTNGGLNICAPLSTAASSPGPQVAGPYRHPPPDTQVGLTVSAGDATGRMQVGVRLTIYASGCVAQGVIIRAGDDTGW